MVVWNSRYCTLLATVDNRVYVGGSVVVTHVSSACSWMSDVSDTFNTTKLFELVQDVNN